RAWRHFYETQAGTSRAIGPSQVYLRFRREAGAWQRKDHPRDPGFRQLAQDLNGHTTFADIGGFCLQFLALRENDYDRQFQRITEIAPALACHETERGTEASHGIGRRNRFLQNEVSAQLKCLTGSGT